MTTTPQIVFVTVKENGVKAARICEIVKQHHDQKQRVLLTVANDEGARYLDQLLWKQPPYSFIPHVIASQSTSIPVAITTQPVNINQAEILINLCPTVNPLFKQFVVVYELYDETHADKALLSQQRLNSYQTGGYHVHRT